MTEHTSDAKRLHSWKAIANYLGRSVRTVRRWEAGEDLPVRRHMHESQASVFAYAEELDDWMRAREQAPIRPAEATLEPELESIAVLPLRYAGPSGGPAWIADGLTEEVLANLAGIHGLRVISRSSSERIAREDRGLAEIGKTLNVQNVLEGAVVTDDARLRVSLRLLNTARDEVVWAENSDGDLSEALDLMQRIARRVAAAMHLNLTEADERRLTRDKIPDFDIWPLLLEARLEAMRWRADTITHAESLLEKAVERAGHHPELCVAMGRTRLQWREAGLSLDPGLLDDAEHWCTLALAQNGASSNARQLQGWIHHARGEIAEAIAAFKAAMTEDWNNPDTLGILANCYMIAGRVSLARPIIDRLMAVDPLTPLTRCLPGYANALEGDFDGAVPAYRNMYEADPGNPVGRLFYVWVLLSAGQNEDAKRVATGFPEVVENSPPADIARMLTSTSSDTLALSESTQALAGANEMFPRLIAQAYALRGDDNACAFWLGEAASRGFVNYPFLAEHDPLLAVVRQSEVVQTALEQIKVAWERIEV